jgi:hypothetical protein
MSKNILVLSLLLAIFPVSISASERTVESTRSVPGLVEQLVGFWIDLVDDLGFGTDGDGKGVGSSGGETANLVIEITPSG